MSRKSALWPGLLLSVVVLLAVTGFTASAAPKARRPSVVPVTAAGLRRVIAARRGHVVLVNFWATWCGPCAEEFPGLVRLQQQYAGKGLSIVFVSADETKDRNTTVASFVAGHGLTRESWIIQGNPNNFIPQFDPQIKNAFALPRTYLYNRQGKLVTVFSDPKSYGEFEKLVKPLL